MMCKKRLRKLAVTAILLFRNLRFAASSPRDVTSLSQGESALRAPVGRGSRPTQHGVASVAFLNNVSR